MLDFDIDLTTSQLVVPTTEVQEAVPEVREQVRVVTHAAGFKAKEPALWNWSDLRDYILVQIEQRHGPQVRDSRKESGIIKGFISRWGIEKAVAIAQTAFDVHDGMWRNAPISITRFSKNCDPYFASIIASNLH